MVIKPKLAEGRVDDDSKLYKNNVVCIVVGMFELFD